MMLRPHLIIDAPLAALAVAAAPTLGWGPAAAAAVGLSAGIHSLAVAHPRCSLYGRVIWRIPATTTVALTFDDGPDPEVTPHLLDLLAAKSVTATFFLIGANAARYPALVRRIRSEGHGLGLHSMTHSRWFCAWPSARVRRDLEDNRAVLSDLTGEAPPDWFRPPVGLRNPLITRVAADLGLTLLTWTANGRDTQGGTDRAILQRLSPGYIPGGILVLHDGVEPGRGPARTACPRLTAQTLEALNARSLTPGALPSSRGFDDGGRD